MEAGHFLNGRRAKGPLHTYDLSFIVHASRIFMLGSEFMIYILDPYSISRVFLGIVSDKSPLAKRGE